MLRRWRFRRRAPRAHGRKELEFLLEATRVLSAAFSYEARLEALARLAVPRLADWCAVDLLREDGRLERLAVAHTDPERVALAHRAHERYPPDPGAAQGVYSVLRTGKPELVREVTDAMLVAAARDAEHLALLRELGIVSAMVVPLAGRTGIFGAITLVSAESGRHFGAADLALAEEFAARAAMMVDNARLYAEGERARQSLEEQATELEAQAAELQEQAAELEVSQAELEMANEQLRVANDELARQIEIAERARAETETALATLRASEESYRSLFNSLTEAVYLLDGEGRFLHVNDAVLCMYGYEREEILGRTPALLAAPGRVDLEETHARIARAMQGEPQRFEWWGRRKSGEIFPKEVVLTRATYMGAPVVIAVARDITERKRAEEALRRREAQLAEAQAIARLGSWEWRADAERLSCSVQMLRNLGLAPEGDGITLDELLERVHPDDRERVLGAIEAAFRHGEPLAEEFRVVWPDGRERVLSARGELVRRSDGPERRLVGTAEDITERRTLENQFRQAQKMEAVGQLTAGIAHDFNNMLTAITGNVELLLMGLPPDDERRAELLEIKEAAARAAALTHKLLAFSRRQLLQPRVLDLNAIVAGTDRLLRRLIGADIELVTVLDPQLGRVRADAGQFEQVLLNLVVNARDAMPEGGTLLIETANVELTEDDRRRHPFVRPGRYVEVRVRDTGVGIPLELLDRIFEPFFTTKEVGRGTGLGLATVYGIVKQSGGYVWVESEAGKGTTFRIDLPRVEAPVEPAPPPAGLPVLVPGRETVLVVEDEKTLRDLVCKVLRRAGYTVLGAPNGDEALRLCAQAEPRIDLLLTDLVMPLMGGRELAERIGAVCPGVPVLYMSGYTDDRIADLPASGAGFLQKPFAPQALLQKVREALDVARRR